MNKMNKINDGSIKNPTIIKKPKLIRGEHVVQENVAGVPVVESQALDDIYYCFEMCMKGKPIHFVYYDYEDGEVIEEEEEEEEDLVAKSQYWENEFFYRDSLLDKDREIIRLVKDDSVFSEGIADFRDKTQVVFKDIFFGIMWKILPAHDDDEANTSTYNTQFDGCFTKNNDSIMDQLNIVNQDRLFGTILDISIENPLYILWTAF